MGSVEQIRKAPAAVQLPEIYDVWQITAKFRGWLMGTMPLDKDELKRFILQVAETPQDQAELGAKLEREVSSEGRPEDETPVYGRRGFKYDPVHGLYIEGRHIKSAYKEAASVLGMTNPSWFTDAPGRQFFQHALFVTPDRIYLGKHKPDGSDTTFGTVPTQRGTRAIITETDYAEGATVSWTVKTLKNFRREKKLSLSDELHRLLLALMQDNGVGAKRAMGHGQFDVMEYEADQANTKDEPRKKASKTE